MIDFFINLDHTIQALLATIFTWGITALGAGLVFFFKKINKSVMDAMLGFAAGVMIAASFWSLLSPAIEMAKSLNMITWLVAFLGFFTGGLLLFIGDKIFNFLNKKKENKNNSFKRSLMLIFSITLHNIPEGMAVGVMYAGFLAENAQITATSALALSLGIAIQNFPEGAIISMPLRAEGESKRKAFLGGVLSGVVEPIGAVMTILVAQLVIPALPYLLSFAAGAMLYVVVEELMPELSQGKHSNLGTVFFAVGFSLMMVLDVALG